MKEIDKIKKKRVLLGPTNAICHLGIRRLCLRPYYKHPKGCPNYARRIDCPPQAPFFPDILKKRVYIAAVVFDFKDYLNMRRNIHPDWTERTLRNPRHWQGHLRSELKKFISEKLSDSNGYGDTVIFNPEAMGVDVTKTCQNAGLKLEWPPQKNVCQVALIGQKRKS